MFISLLLFSLISNQPNPQLTCEEAKSFTAQSESNLGDVVNWLQRLRELAIQGNSELLSNRERGFLDDEYQQIRDELFRILDQAKFVDALGNSYLYFKNGFSFSTPIEIKGSGFAYLKEFSFDPVSRKNLGTFASQEFSLRDIRVNDNLEKGYEISVNGIPTYSSVVNDTLSDAGAGLSAISLAASINMNTGIHGVYATVLPNRVILSPEFVSQLEEGSVLYEGDLQINRVDIVGYINSNLESLIQDFSTSTAVHAKRNSLGGIEIVSDDGRNIHIEYSKGQANFESGHIFTGSVFLYSPDYFYIEYDDGFPVLESFSDEDKVIEIYLNSASSLAFSTIATLDESNSALKTVDQSFGQVNRARVQAGIPLVYCR